MSTLLKIALIILGFLTIMSGINAWGFFGIFYPNNTIQENVPVATSYAITSANELGKHLEKEELKFTICRSGGDEFEIFLSMPKKENYKYEKDIINFEKKFLEITDNIWEKKKIKLMQNDTKYKNLPKISFAIAHSFTSDFNHKYDNNIRKIKSYLKSMRREADDKMYKNKKDMKKEL